VSEKGNKERRLEIVKATKKCGFCPPHGGENQGRRPKTDKNKNLWKALRKKKEEVE
jgi:hypothetical protein